jgi:hypothetical protein
MSKLIWTCRRRGQRCGISVAESAHKESFLRLGFRRKFRQKRALSRRVKHNVNAPYMNGRPEGLRAKVSMTPSAEGGSATPEERVRKGQKVAALGARASGSKARRWACYMRTALWGLA